MKTHQMIVNAIFFFALFLSNLAGATAQTDKQTTGPVEPDTIFANETAVPLSDNDGNTAGAPPPKPPAQVLPASPPALYQPAMSRNPGRGLRIAGFSTLGGGYGSSLIMAMIASGSDEGNFFYIPVVGSFIAGAKVVDDIVGFADSGPALGLFILIGLPSITQLTGIALLTAGIVKNKKWKRRSRAFSYRVVSADTDNKAKKDMTVSMVPVGPGGSPGLSLSGRF
ncbi:MAG: hypothetical protein GY847_27225 [Proteobacteria bacterium]|nr:hypothetical protein [Pseudomonadota bacterium]